LSRLVDHEVRSDTACDLTGDEFDVSGPTISHHLKVLREAVLIDGDRRGLVLHRVETHRYLG
jgi:ArsR family transcriptional regulator